MKHTFTVTAAALAAVSSVTLLGMYLTSETAEQKPLPKQAEAVQQRVLNSPKEAEDYEYILAEYEGRLAVFLPNQITPKKVFDVYISTLPQKDQQDLKKGVGAADYAELVALLEDYVS